MPLDSAAVKALFLEAAVLEDANARDALLTERCGTDAALLARVRALLAASDYAVANEQTGPTHGAEAEDHVGKVLAEKYKLIESIGEGGMGSVYMAQQTEPVKRAVALKVIKAGMDSKAVLARFDLEKQALAMMDHPNIAKVLDAGATANGRPFFVMELVKGVPITEFCDSRKLTPRQRLELFVPVCNAIQHAHQKGIIHRDIKPSNVLVALYDDRPVPKVIDFGVAKAAGQPLTDRTLMTGFGALVGTPEYMSPEMASLNNMDIDTRSDVYALGVLLYELLTGHTPVDRKSLGNTVPSHDNDSTRRTPTSRLQQQQMDPPHHPRRSVFRPQTSCTPNGRGRLGPKNMTPHRRLSAQKPRPHQPRPTRPNPFPAEPGHPCFRRFRSPFTGRTRVYRNGVVNLSGDLNQTRGGRGRFHRGHISRLHICFDRSPMGRMDWRQNDTR